MTRQSREYSCIFIFELTLSSKLINIQRNTVRNSIDYDLADLPICALLILLYRLYARFNSDCAFSRFFLRITVKLLCERIL